MCILLSVHFCVCHAINTPWTYFFSALLSSVPILFSVHFSVCPFCWLSWYNHPGWLGIKNPSYLPFLLLFALVHISFQFSVHCQSISALLRIRLSAYFCAGQSISTLLSILLSVYFCTRQSISALLRIYTCTGQSISALLRIRLSVYFCTGQSISALLRIQLSVYFFICQSISALLQFLLCTSVLAI